MQKVILDTSFIISCVRNKIDFIEDLEFMGFQVFIPKQVFHELEGITRSKQKAHSRDDAHLAIKVLKANDHKFEEMDLRTPNVDQGIYEYAQKHRDVSVATLDAELKKKIFNRKIVIREKNRLGSE